MNKPNFSYEKKLWKKGFKLVAGIDEVGRGCFAGPVIAAAAAFAPNSNFQIPISNKKGEKIFINDSKKLSSKKREVADVWLRNNLLAWGVGTASVAEINRLGLSKATFSAFRRSITDCVKRNDVRVDYLLIDAFYLPYIRGLRMPSKTEKRKNRKTDKLKDLKFSGGQLAIVNGDEKSFSIAAASIIAKVYRDRLMKNLSKNPNYKKYSWSKNKGYGTKEHQLAIKKYGITKMHRKKFVENYL